MDTVKKIKMVSLRLTKEALVILDTCSKEQGVSKTAIVEMALRSWSKKEGSK